jgi:hypothetical protein
MNVAGFPRDLGGFGKVDCTEIIFIDSGGGSLRETKGVGKVAVVKELFGGFR